VRDSIGNPLFVPLLNNEKWMYHAVACPVEILVRHFCEDMFRKEDGNLKSNVSKNSRFQHLKTGTRAFFTKHYITEIILSLANGDTELWDIQENDIHAFLRKTKSKNKKGDTEVSSWAHATNTDVIQLWKELSKKKETDKIPYPNLAILCVLYALWLTEQHDAKLLLNHYKSIPTTTSRKGKKPFPSFRNIDYGMTLQEFIRTKIEGQGETVKFLFHKKQVQSQKRKREKNDDGKTQNKKAKPAQETSDDDDEIEQDTENHGIGETQNKKARLAQEASDEDEQQIEPDSPDPGIYLLQCFNHFNTNAGRAAIVAQILNASRRYDEKIYSLNDGSLQMMDSTEMDTDDQP
jgi:hypothetical protein